MLGINYGKRLKELASDYVVFDLETTGISSQNDKIIEISAVKVQNGAIVQEFSELVNPKCKIPYQASQINGITDDMVEDARTIDQVLPDFLDFIEEEILVGHNIHSFDMKFICRECKDIYDKVLGNNYIDTLYLARKCLPKLGHHRLTDLAEYFAIPTEGAHRALNDCRMNQRVYEGLRKLATERRV